MRYAGHTTVLVAVLVAFTACGGPPDLLADGKYACASDSACPEGWVCVASRCLAEAPQRSTTGCQPSSCADDDPCTFAACVDETCHGLTTSACGLHDGSSNHLRWLFIRLSRAAESSSSLGVGFEELSATSSKTRSYYLSGYGPGQEDQPEPKWAMGSNPTAVGAAPDDADAPCASIGPAFEGEGGATWNPDDFGVFCRGKSDDEPPDASEWFTHGLLSTDRQLGVLGNQDGDLVLMWSQSPEDVAADALAGRWRIVAVEDGAQLRSHLPAGEQEARGALPSAIGGWTGAVSFEMDDDRTCLVGEDANLVPDGVHAAGVDGAPLIAGPVGLHPRSDGERCFGVNAQGEFVFEHWELAVDGVDGLGWRREVAWVGWVNPALGIAVASVWLVGSLDGVAERGGDVFDWAAHGPQVDALVLLVRDGATTHAVDTLDGRWITESLHHGDVDTFGRATGWLDVVSSGAVEGGHMVETETGQPLTSPAGGTSIDATGVMTAAGWMDALSLQGFALSGGEPLGRSPLAVLYDADAHGLMETPGLTFGIWAAPRGGW